MTVRTGFSIYAGVAPDHVEDAAQLYWDAFGGKLGRVLRPEARAIGYVSAVLRPDHGFSAVGADGALLGIAGFRTLQGSFVDGGLTDMMAAYGIAGGTLRHWALRIVPRDSESRAFLIDGIAVRRDMRGLGIGTALLDALCEEARLRGHPAIRLDVIPENARARALYERMGFCVTGARRSRTGALVLGYEESLKMVREI